MISEIYSRIEHVPRSWAYYSISIVFFLGCVVLARIQDVRDNRKHYSNPRREIQRVLGNTAHEAPANSGVRWSITKGGLLHFGGKIKKSPLVGVKKYLDQRTSEMQLELDNNHSRGQCTYIEGIQVDTYYAKKLWEENVLTTSHFVHALSGRHETVISGVIFGGLELKLFIRDDYPNDIVPIKFRLASRCLGEKALNKLHLPTISKTSESAIVAR